MIFTKFVQIRVIRGLCKKIEKISEKWSTEKFTINYQLFTIYQIVQWIVNS